MVTSEKMNGHARPAVELASSIAPEFFLTETLTLSAREGGNPERAIVTVQGKKPALEGGIDLDRAAWAVGELLAALGVDCQRDGLCETPTRVARAYAELLSPEPFEVTTFPNDEGYDQLVMVRDITFSSLCEHHLMPFAGVAHVGYLPADRLLGLSKLARVIGHFAARLQVQERLTAQIAGWLSDKLGPRGVGVVLEAEHACMSCRGVRAAGAHTVTSTLVGAIRDDERTRAEFLALTRC